MSYQAYLDAIETKTGTPPQELIGLAHERGLGPSSEAGDVVAWLQEDFDLGRGHAMAFFGVLKNGPEISDKHVGTTGVHRDAATTLRLDGKANR